MWVLVGPPDETRACSDAGPFLFSSKAARCGAYMVRSADIAAGKPEVKQLTSQVQVEQGARALEQAKDQELARIGATQGEDREAAKAVPAAVGADLHAGNVRLRREWAAHEANRVPGSAASAAERDALVELRATDRGDSVRVGRDADDQIHVCQAVIGVRGSWPERPAHWCGKANVEVLRRRTGLGTAVCIDLVALRFTHHAICQAAMETHVAHGAWSDLRGGEARCSNEQEQHGLQGLLDHHVSPLSARNRACLTLHVESPPLNMRCRMR